MLIFVCTYLWGEIKEIKSSQRSLEQKSREQMESKEADKLIVSIRKHVILPKYEKPLIATIIDSEKMKRESHFYDLAENGDIVLVYINSKMAYLYRPETDKILNVGPLMVNSNIDYSKLSPSLQLIED
jgi:hypothetical protein